VCSSAETSIVGALDKSLYDVEIVHLGNSKGRIPEAEKLGVKSVPALALGGQVFHINYGAGLSDLK
jgi:hypothetical protein